MEIRTQAPVTVLYNGNIRDTAILVGLVQSRVSIGIIAYTGPIEKEKMDYVRAVNSWLALKEQPLILIHPYLAYEQLERILADPFPVWGWDLDDAKAAITLAGLRLPP
jgi:hypothetical protein